MSYADTRSRAAEAIERKGQAMTLNYIGGSTYNPETGTTSGAAPDPVTVSGVILPLSPFRKSVGNLIEGDQQLLLAAENTAGAPIATPQVNAIVRDASGADWTLVAVEPLNPGGTAVVHDCIIRKAA